MREKLSPTTKESEDEEKVKAAREHAKKEGMTNVFEDLAAVEPSSTPEQESAAKVREVSKDHSVRVMASLHGDQLMPLSKHKYSTANFKISHRKLNMLANQLAGKPIDHAILQMQFSEKRASNRIMNMLATARDHASRYKKLEQDKLIVCACSPSFHEQFH